MIDLPAAIHDELVASGVPWRAEIGSKHVKIFVRGHLVGVCSRGCRKEDAGRGCKNLLAQVRRAIRNGRRQRSAATGGKGGA